MNTRRLICLLGTLTILLPVFATAQNAKHPARSAKSAPPIPRAADGKPDLTGVYQGGSTKPGTWEEANRGIGVAAPEDRAIVGPAPRQDDTPSYQPWAAKLLTDNYNRRNIDGSSAYCLPNIAMSTVSLFPVQFVQTPQQIVILEEYMSVFRIIPLTSEIPSATGKATLWWSIRSVSKRCFTPRVAEGEATAMLCISPSASPVSTTTRSITT